MQVTLAAACIFMRRPCGSIYPIRKRGYRPDMNLKMFSDDRSITCQAGLMRVHINMRLSDCRVVTLLLVGQVMFCNTFLGAVSLNNLWQ